MQGIVLLTGEDPLIIVEFAKFFRPGLPYLPAYLVLLRFGLGPVLIADALDGKTGSVFMVAFVAAFLSDVFDGMIARRLNVSTAQLRQADSTADVTLYLCVSASAWLVHPETLAAFRSPLLAVVGVQLLWWAVNLLKYGKPASYHTYSAKLWGLTLFVATVALFGFNSSGLALWLAVVVGIVHSLEEIAMTLILPVWMHDISSLARALHLRQNAIANRTRFFPDSRCGINEVRAASQDSR